MALFGRDAEEISNLRDSAFQVLQIEDAYEKEPLLSKVSFLKRMRGRNGAFPPSDDKELKERAKTPVYCCCTVNEVTTIDTKTNTFTARISLYLVLDVDIAGITKRLKEELEECVDEGRLALKVEREKKLQMWTEIVENSVDDGCPYKIEDEEYQVFEEEIEWPESLELYNQITADQTEDPQFVILENTMDANGNVEKALVWIEFMTGLYECKEYQELEYFPFDLQDLTLDFQLTSRSDIDKFDLRLHTVEFYRPCLQMAEWVMYPPESDRKGTAKTEVRLRATRKSHFYVTNIVGAMCVLNLMCIGAFGIEIPDIADRLSVTLTMMLTAVAFKFIVGDQLPKVSYNTYLDIYLIYTYVFMFLISAYFCTGPHIWKAYYDLDDIGGDPGEQVVGDVSEADHWVCVAFSILFFMFTSYWFYGAYKIVAELKEELPPPITLDDGVDHISYRWQKVPFKGFRNPESERVRAGYQDHNVEDEPENIERSAVTIEAMDVRTPLVPQTPPIGGATMEMPTAAKQPENDESGEVMITGKIGKRSPDSNLQAKSPSHEASLQL